MDALREAVEQLGSLADSTDEARGWALVASATAAVAGTVWAWLRKRQVPDRTRVNVDAPKGERVSVIVGDYKD
jgi:cobalamin biosynthesis protein CbiD